MTIEQLIDAQVARFSHLGGNTQAEIRTALLAVHQFHAPPAHEEKPTLTAKVKTALKGNK